MKKVFYKIKYDTFFGNQECEFEDITMAVKKYKNLKNQADFVNVKFYIITRIEEELTEEEIPSV